MAGFPLAAIGAGIGLGVKEISEQRQRQQQMQLQQLGMQRELAMLGMYLRNQQNASDLATLSAPMGGAGTDTGFGAPPMGGQFGDLSQLSNIDGGGGAPQMGGPSSAAGRFGGMSLPSGGMAGSLTLSNVTGPFAGQSGENPYGSLASRWDVPTTPPDLSGMGAPGGAGAPPPAPGVPGLLKQRNTVAGSAATPMTPNIPPPRGEGGFKPPTGPPATSGSSTAPSAQPSPGAGGDTAERPTQMAQAGGQVGQPPSYQDALAEAQRRAAAIQQRTGRAVDPAVIGKATQNIYTEMYKEWSARKSMGLYERGAATQERAAAASERAAKASERAEELAGKGNPEPLLVKQPDGSMKAEMVTYDKRRNAYVNQRGQQVEVQPMPGKEGDKGSGEHLQAFDTEGKMIFEGNAHYVPGTGWEDDAHPGTRIPGDRFITLPRGAGGAAGRAGAQVQRQIIAAREIASDLQNVVRLPITTTRGIFGGRQQGPGLMDALKENLAEKLTNEDAELANSALASLERELSVVVSPVYGGSWAADSFKPLALKEGQTNLVKLYNIARMRQTADNALEGVINTDWVGKEQKAYAQQLMGVLEKAVPWTPGDVMSYREQTDNRLSFGDFVKQQHVGGGAGGAPAAGPQPGHVEDGFRFKGGNPGDASNWEKVQEGAQ
jgi:hypothetical protein